MNYNNLVIFFLICLLYTEYNLIVKLNNRDKFNCFFNRIYLKQQSI